MWLVCFMLTWFQTLYFLRLYRVPQMPHCWLVKFQYFLSLKVFLSTLMIKIEVLVFNYYFEHLKLLKVISFTSLLNWNCHKTWKHLFSDTIRNDMNSQWNLTTSHSSDNNLLYLVTFSLNLALIRVWTVFFLESKYRRKLPAQNRSICQLWSVDNLLLCHPTHTIHFLNSIAHALHKKARLAALLQHKSISQK